MARKRKVAPNAEMVRLLEKRKAQEAEFERELKALEAAREAQWLEDGQLVDSCGLANMPKDEKRAKFERIAKEQEAPPKAA